MFNPAYVGRRPDILALIPGAARRVLDVGCATGSLGAEVKSVRGAHVTGVELMPEMAAVAAERLDRVFTGSAEAFFDAPAHADDRFDAIVFGDVLEHLVDPWAVLRAARARLGDGGAIVLSLPNVRHVDTLWHLVVRGEWPYRERGIHDRTHLRFFTWRNVEVLLAQAGLRAVQVDRTYRLFERPHRWNARFARLVRHLPGLREFFVFQYVVRAEPAAVAAAAPAAPVSPTSVATAPSAPPVTASTPLAATDRAE